MNIRAAVCIGVMLAACGDDGGGGPDASMIDASVIDASVAPDAISNDITGTIIDRFVTQTSEVLVPHDLTTDFDFEVLVPDGDGGFTTFTPIGMADGTFIVPDVPPGIALIRNGRSYTYTSRRHFDFGISQYRRADAVPTEGPASLRFNVDGMAPWQDGHRIEIRVPEVDGLYYIGWSDPMEIPLNGDTALTSIVDYGTGMNHFVGYAHLFDTALGDHVFVNQRVKRMTPAGWTYEFIERVFEPESLTLLENDTIDVSGSFEPVAQNRSVSLDLDMAALAEQRSQMLPPGSQEVYAVTGFNIDAVFRSALGADGMFAWLVSSRLDQNISGRVSVEYGNPFGGDVVETAILYNGASRTYQDSNGTTMNLSAISYTRAEVDRLTLSPAVPTLSPVRNPRIDGLDAFTVNSNVSTTPRLSWDAVPGDEITHYSIRVNNLTDRRRFVAIFDTTDTSIQILPDILEPGKSYVFEIFALNNELHPVFGAGSPRSGYSRAGLLTEQQIIVSAD